MRHLILIRHANAEARIPGQSDAARPLSRRGEREAAAAGKALLAGGLPPALIVSSPSGRTTATARILAGIIGIPETEILFLDAVYNATCQDLLRVVAEFPDATDRIALVGHYPSLSDLAGILAEPGSAVIGEMHTGSVIHIALDAPSWKQAARTRGPAVRMTG